MTHDDIRHKLSEYIDNAVSAAERAEVEAHLATCAECGRALQELKKTIEQVKAVEEMEPPAWMTQKIMANVRAEAEKKTSWYERFLLPGSLRFPIQAVAVVFLAVTAFAIYRNIQPAQKASEAPVQEFAAKSQSDKDAQPAPSVQTDTAKKLAQSPEYKALDMKLEYEQPAEPKLMNKAEAPAPAAAAPAPMKSVEKTMPASHDAISAKGAAAPEVGASALMQEEAASAGAASMANAKRKSAQQALRGEPAVQAANVIIVRVKDIEAAAKEFEKMNAEFGGTITKRETPAAKRVYVITIDSLKLQEFKKKLKLIGEMKDEVAAPAPQDGRVELRIELVRDTT